MIILIKLILAHFIGDFIFQTKNWVTNKEKYKIKSSKLYLHLIVHLLTMSILLGNLTYWKLILAITLTHGIIDILKLYLQKTKTKTVWFIIDQSLHILSIFIIWQYYTSHYICFNCWFESINFWLLLTSLVFLTYISGIVIKILLSSWSLKLENNLNDSLSKAGTYIGILERLFVFIFIITSHWEAIGFLLAAKSVFRFGDLKDSKDRKLTEYMLIGTLLSFGIAILVGLLVSNLLL